MKKSIIITFGAVLVLAILIGDGSRKGAAKEGSDRAYQAAANQTENTGMITIEDEAVPMAASVPTNSAEEVQEDTAEVKEESLSTEETENTNIESTNTESTKASASAEQPQEAQSEEVEISPCLLGGAHTTVWTDFGDYKVMKCTGCGQEIGGRAVNLGDGIYGYYDDAMAKSLFEGVNQIRIGCTLEETLNETAKSRALDCAGNFSHNEMVTDSECIAKGQQSADGAVKAWNASSYHRSLLIDPMYLEGGTACLWYDSGDGTMQPIWVLVLDK